MICMILYDLYDMYDLYALAHVVARGSRLVYML